MQTIQIEVKENYVSNILEILNGLKNVMIEKISVEEPKANSLESVSKNDSDYNHFEKAKSGEFRDFNLFLKEMNK